MAVRRNKKILESKEKADKGAEFTSIIWSADDLAEHSFLITPYDTNKRASIGDESDEKQAKTEEQPEKKHTVSSYFLDKYGKKLRYPEMPCVYTGRNEWCPVEFVCQAFGKAKDANDIGKVQATLGYYDEYASTSCVQNITQNNRRLANMQGNLPQDTLKLFGLIQSEEPTAISAKILRRPRLVFQGHGKENVTNGSCNLARKIFFK